MNDTTKTQERILNRTNRTSTCWIWQGNIEPHTGRGRYSQTWAHRASYQAFIGPIPDGHELHHRCHNPLCVNPAHLQPVTHAEHTQLHVRTHCLHGHSYAEHARTTIAGKHVCRTCDAERNKRRRLAAQRPCKNCGQPRNPSGRKHYTDTGLCVHCYTDSLKTHAKGGWSARR